MRQLSLFWVSSLHCCVAVQLRFACASFHLVLNRKDRQEVEVADPGVGCPPTFCLAGCKDREWVILDVLLHKTEHGRGCGNQAPLPKAMKSH